MLLPQVLQLILGMFVHVFQAALIVEIMHLVYEMCTCLSMYST